MSEAERLPIEMVWAEGCFRPISLFWARRAADQYADGEVIAVTEHRDRSSKSHRHYFACINTAFENLPEHVGARFAGPEMLRKHTLIRAGHCTSTEMVCTTAREAARFAAFLSQDDEYALVVVRGAVITRYRAKSQRKDFQDHAEFQKSKQDVLELLAGMLGISVETLTQEGRKAVTVLQPMPKALPAPSKDREAA